MLRPSSNCGSGDGVGRDMSTVGIVRIGRERSPLDSVAATANALPQILRPCHTFRALWLWPGVVVCELNSQLSGVFALAVQPLPEIALASARHQNLIQVDQCLANQICRLLVLAEDGNLERMVVKRVVDSEPKFLIPATTC